MAQAQSTEVYSSGNLNNNDTYNDGNTSNPTRTQGAVGNPFCAPPHETIDGKDVTPLNWSCLTVQQPYVIPHAMTAARPGPTDQPGAVNPCQPGGPRRLQLSGQSGGHAIAAGLRAPHHRRDHHCQDRSALPNRAARELPRAREAAGQLKSIPPPEADGSA